MKTNPRAPRPVRLGMRLVLVAAVVAPSTAAPATAFGPEPHIGRSQGARRAAGDARARVDHLRGALRGGKLADGLAAILERHGGAFSTED
ncbi:MAG: hypothetical protein M3245_03465, partial [Actinomycetota bacterium]|nr:hypothetical protein [Actinomycetota bacterium]